MMKIGTTRTENDILRLDIRVVIPAFVPRKKWRQDRWEFRPVWSLERARFELALPMYSHQHSPDVLSLSRVAIATENTVAKESCCLALRPVPGRCNCHYDRYDF